jgi:hypothetical protein
MYLKYFMPNNLFSHSAFPTSKFSKYYRGSWNCILKFSFFTFLWLLQRNGKSLYLNGVAVVKKKCLTAVLAVSEANRKCCVNI